MPLSRCEKHDRSMEYLPGDRDGHTKLRCPDCEEEKRLGKLWEGAAPQVRYGQNWTRDISYKQAGMTRPPLKPS